MSRNERRDSETGSREERSDLSVRVGGSRILTSGHFKKKRGSSYKLPLFFLNGRAGRISDAHPYFHDFIENTFSSTRLIIVPAKPLYEQGYTLREIAKRLGVSKTSVRKSLILEGVDLRSDNRYLKKKSRPPGAPHVGAAPYGYCVIKGRLVEVPKEIEVIQLVLDLWQKGIPYNAIAKHLNHHGVKPRVAKKWEHTTIMSIVKRHNESST